MPDKSEAPTPRDLANEAEKMVVSLPQSAYALLLCLSTGDGGREDILVKLQTSQRYLEKDFEKGFRTVAKDVSEDLRDARQRLVACLAGFEDSLPAPQEASARGSLRELGRRIENDLAPTVSRFLGALFDQVVAFEKAEAKRAQDADAEALTQIDLISRKINFIAVNASVEASRAGEVGRGFAVIASEIKDLSQQSKNAVERVRSALF